MKVAIVKETAPYEARVATSPDVIKKLVGQGLHVVVETGAGLTSGMPDQAMVDAGASLSGSAVEAVTGADILLTVQRPTDEVRSALKPGAVIVGQLAPFDNAADLDAYAAQNLTTFSLELLPRITRAQSMDVLSSQANLAGYRAVLDAAGVYGRAFPMMMTAAGTVPPAKVLVMGAGVAGLQAIATAKRLGGVVSATDVRPEVKEQVQSLGGSFLEVEGAETPASEGGYAKETSEEYKQKQAELIRQTLTKTDIVITTALIPGRPAPRLITRDMLALMKPGSVVLDLAVERGGNVEGSVLGEVTDVGGVKVIGYANLPSRIASESSRLYAKNLLTFLGLVVKAEKEGAPELAIDWKDELITGCGLTRDGKIVHPRFAPEDATPAADAS